MSLLSSPFLILWNLILSFVLPLSTISLSSVSFLGLFQLADFSSHEKYFSASWYACAAFLSVWLSPLWCSALWTLAATASMLSPYIRETTGPFLGFSSCAVTLWIRAIIRHTSFVAFLSGSTELYCLMSRVWKLLFHIFLSTSLVYSMRANPVLVLYDGMKEMSPTQCTLECWAVL